MIIGSNPRKEAPVLNARIRKRWLKGGFPIGVIGEQADLTYDYAYLGAGPETLATFADHAPAKMERPMILIGQGALAREDGLAVLALAAKAAASLGVDQGRLERTRDPAYRGGARRRPRSRLRPAATAASTPARWRKAGALDVLFNLGADEIDVEPGAFVVYQGTHGDRGAARADVILPGRRLHREIGHLRQHGGASCSLPIAPIFRRATRARIGRSCAPCRRCSGARLPFELAEGACARASSRRFPHLGAVRSKSPPARALDAAGARRRAAGACGGAPFDVAVADFYLTNPIARASAVMAECSALSESLERQAAE